MDKTRMQSEFNLDAAGGQLQLRAVTPEIIHVRFLAAPALAPQPSLAVLPDAGGPAAFTRSELQDGIELATGVLLVQIRRLDGRITFKSATGETLLAETAREFTPAAVLGEKTFHVRQGFCLTPTEGLFGLGQYQDGLMNYRNHDVLLVQANKAAVVPFLVSSRGWGLLWDNNSQTRFHDGADGMHFWSEVGEATDYYFVAGRNPDATVAGYRLLTGAAPLPPKWAFGYQQCKEHYASRDELLAVAREYRRRGIPLDLMIQDWRYWGERDNWSGMEWDAGRYPDPEGMLKILHDDLHLRLMISIWPSLGPKSRLFQALQARGLLLTPPHWCGGRVYDAFAAEARDIYWEFTRRGLFDKGVDAFWMDGTEPEFDSTDTPADTAQAILACGRHAAGSAARHLNAYSLVTTRGIYEGQRRTSEEKRVMILTRSAFSGQQRYAAATWSGDISANWQVFRRQISAGVNFCLAGIPYWTTDIGAFFPGGRGGEYPDGVQDPAYRELYVRWFQFGAFCPLFRAHGTGTPREIWRFGEPGSREYETLVGFTRLRYRLLPYIYSQAWAVTSRGSTLMRGLVMDFPDDPAGYGVDDQFMFGSSLLVKPVTEPMYHKTRRQLPAVTEEFLENTEDNPGLTADLFQGENFDTPVHRKNHAMLDWNWRGGPPRGVGLDHYSIRWSGFLKAPESGEYQLETLADDGVRLWLDGELLIDNWQIQEPRRSTVQVNLNAGRKHALRIEFFHHTGGGILRLGWQTPAMAMAAAAETATPAAADAQAVPVYLPAGSGWYDFWTNDFHQGGRTVNRAAPLEILPLFVRAGTILPVGPELQYTDEKPANPIELRIYAGANGDFTLYEDEGDSYRYEQGIHATVAFQWDEQAGELQIGERQGTFPGMPASRVFNLVLVEPAAGPRPARSIRYTGTAQRLQLRD